MSFEKSKQQLVPPLKCERENPVRRSMDENETLMKSVRNKSDRALLKRILPDAAVRLSRSAELAELETGYEFRQRALKLAVDAKVQAVEEACNHVLVTGKGEIRRERQEFFASQFARLTQAMHEFAEEFNTDVDRRLTAIETKYQNEAIRDQERTRLYRQVESFHAALDDMEQEFRNILHEGVHAESPLRKTF